MRVSAKVSSCNHVSAFFASRLKRYEKQQKLRLTILMMIRKPPMKAVFVKHRKMIRFFSYRIIPENRWHVLEKIYSKVLFRDISYWRSILVEIMVSGKLPLDNSPGEFPRRIFYQEFPLVNSPARLRVGVRFRAGTRGIWSGGIHRGELPSENSPRRFHRGNSPRTNYYKEQKL